VHQLNDPCPTCGAAELAGVSICSATANLICLGDEYVPGCGRELTAEERHWYGHICETCTRASDERVRLWREGGADVELDKIFDDKPVLQ
jgi:hypothetical protein